MKLMKFIGSILIGYTACRVSCDKLSVCDYCVDFPGAIPCSAIDDQINKNPMASKQASAQGTFCQVAYMACLDQPSAADNCVNALCRCLAVSGGCNSHYMR